jgi:DnaA regulatory inactivator Hda
MQQTTISLPRQLPVDFSTFLVEKPNQEAFFWLSSYPNWPLSQIVVVGPEGSGKSHLAKALSQKFQGSLIPPNSLDLLTDPLTLGRSTSLIIVDDYDRISSENNLFHFYNLAREHHRQVIYFGRTAPAQVSFKVPDLASRLRSLPCFTIEEPDDALFHKLFRKELVTRGIPCDDEVLEYIYRRFDRSYATIQQLVTLIDKQTLAQQRGLTLPFLKEIIP